MLLNLDTIPHFYKNYIKQVEETDLLQALRISGHRALELIHAIPESKIDFAYAAGKWTVREVFCHLIDAERIFAYRALRFARNDKTELAGWEENDYTPQANAAGRTMHKIAAEMAHVRSATIDLFESFTPEMLTRKGIANKNELSVMALGFVIAGHETHHSHILKDRYLRS
ncbi:MAG: DinB family protein [Cyclobacteriaceae bacterium]|nr:DinB family protein [Cytophagales bacterium]MBX2899376.1 DinB family protein [Cyclobacteriaceae bacterium]